MKNLGIENAGHELVLGDATKIAIVLTDGGSTEPDLTRHSADHLHKLGVETFAIGIGNNVDVNELHMIASDNDHTFRVTNFEQLELIHKNVVDKICSTSKHVPPTTTTTTTTTTTSTPRPTTPTTALPSTTNKAACGLKPADIVFVLDSSDSEGAENFKTEVEFVYDFAAQFSIGTNNVQFSVVTYSSDVRNEFFFNNFTSRNAVLHAIRNIQYMGQGTNTSGALNFVRTESFLPVHGARANSTKFVIVITDGRSDNQNATKTEADLLHRLAHVLSVGIGPGVDSTVSQHGIQPQSCYGGQLCLTSFHKETTDRPCL